MPRNVLLIFSTMVLVHVLTLSKLCNIMHCYMFPVCLDFYYIYMCVCVCVCVCEREREREGER